MCQYSRPYIKQRNQENSWICYEILHIWTYFFERGPISKDLRLEFARYYNSFNDNRSEIGQGWDITPYGLRFIRAKCEISAKNQVLSICSYPEILLFERGIGKVYKAITFNQEKDLVFLSENDKNSQLIHRKKGFVLHKEETDIFFDENGKIILEKDRYNNELHYEYQNNNLKIISSNRGKKIELDYKDNRIIQIKGPGKKNVKFVYDKNNRLESVYDGIGKLFSYSWDIAGNLIKIIDGKDQLIFEVSYDNYHRAISEKNGKRLTNKTYNLSSREMNMEIGKKEIFSNFDSKYRLINMKDTFGRSIAFEYLDQPKTNWENERNDYKYIYDILVSIQESVTGAPIA